MCCLLVFDEGRSERVLHRMVWAGGDCDGVECCQGIRAGSRQGLERRLRDAELATGCFASRCACATRPMDTLKHRTLLSGLACIRRCRSAGAVSGGSAKGSSISSRVMRRSRRQARLSGCRRRRRGGGEEAAMASVLLQHVGQSRCQRQKTPNGAWMGAGPVCWQSWRTSIGPVWRRWQTRRCLGWGSRGWA
jgi:hypothetical protein